GLQTQIRRDLAGWQKASDKSAQRCDASRDRLRARRPKTSRCFPPDVLGGKHYAEHFGALLVRWRTQLQKVDRTGECGSKGHAGSDSIAEAAGRGALRRKPAKALVSALARNQSEGLDSGRTNARSRCRRQS